MNKVRIIALAVLAAILLTALPAYAIWQNNDESYMLNAINQERTTRGLRPLQLDDSLTTVARDYAKEMAAGHFFGHDSPVSGSYSERVGKFRLQQPWLATAENLSLIEGSNLPASNAADSFRNLMNSPEHRANILSPNFTHVGIGYYYVTDSNGITHKYWVQEFAKYSSAATAAKVIRKKSMHKARKSHKKRGKKTSKRHR